MCTAKWPMQKGPLCARCSFFNRNDMFHLFHHEWVLVVCCERESRSDCNNNYVCIRIIDKECLIQFIFLHLPPPHTLKCSRSDSIKSPYFNFNYLFSSISFFSRSLCFPSKQFTVWLCGTSHVELNVSWKNGLFFLQNQKRQFITASFIRMVPFLPLNSYEVRNFLWKKCSIFFDFGRFEKKKANSELNCFVANLWTVLLNAKEKQCIW